MVVEVPSGPPLNSKLGHRGSRVQHHRQCRLLVLRCAWLLDRGVGLWDVHAACR